MGIPGAPEGIGVLACAGETGCLISAIQGNSISEASGGKVTTREGVRQGTGVERGGENITGGNNAIVPQKNGFTEGYTGIKKQTAIFEAETREIIRREIMPVSWAWRNPF